MTNMMGVGPFITIPLLMTALGGPQAMLGWLVALLIVIPDGMVWSELGSAMPGSGGSYVYLAKGTAARRWGRLAAFLFIWQFILSGPLEIASGYIGFSQYLGYLWPSLTADALCADCRGGRAAEPRAAVSADRIARPADRHAVGRQPPDDRGGDRHGRAPFRSRRSRSTFPPGAFNFSLGFLVGLGAASRVGIYDYLGYYDICYIGDEVKDPRARHPALDPDQHHLASRRSTWRSTSRSSASCRGASSCPRMRIPARGSSSRCSWRGSTAAPSRRSSRRRSCGRRSDRCSRCCSATRAFRTRRRRTAISSRRSRACIRRGAFPLHLADRRRRGVDRLQLLLAGDGHRRADHDAHPRAVHGADRRAHAAAAPQGRQARDVPDVAVSAAQPRRAGGLDLRVRDVGRAA